MALCVIVEDQPLQRRTLAATLRAAGYQTLTCGTGGEGRRLSAEHRPEIVLLDLGLPDMDGLDLIPSLVDESPITRVVVLTGRDSVAVAVAALRAGARHYLVKPWDPDELLLVLERELRAVNREEARLRETESEVLWGSNRDMQAVEESLRKLAAAPLTSVLLEGETGTGKELVARELHRLTAPRGPFVALSCAAVADDQVEGELFGRERGAGDGAERRRGVVELAHDGTLLVDDVGGLSTGVQAKLQRFLADGTFRRLGDEGEHVSRCRVVASTETDLDALARQGRFRGDLLLQLSVVRLRLPPLRERRDDALALTHFLLHRIARRLGRPPRPLATAAEEAILRHPWPGNLRELANRLERAMVLSDSGRIQPSDLDLHPAT